MATKRSTKRQPKEKTESELAECLLHQKPDCQCLHKVLDEEQLKYRLRGEYRTRLIMGMDVTQFLAKWTDYTAVFTAQDSDECQKIALAGKTARQQWQDSGSTAK